LNKLFPWLGDKNKQSARTGKTPERADDALNEAAAASREGDIKAATKLFEESIRIYQSLGMKQEEAAANYAFAAALVNASEFTAAFEAFAASIGLYRALSLDRELASVLRDAGRASAEYSDPELASAQLRESLSLYKSLGDNRGIASTLQALGGAAFGDGNTGEAQDYYNRSLDLCTELELSDQAALCLAYLSLLAADQGDFDTARSHYFASIDRYRSIPAASPLSETLADLGQAAFAEVSLSQVSELLTAATDIYSHARSSGSDTASDLRIEATACHILAPIAYSQDRKELALTLLDRSIDIARGSSDESAHCYSLLQAGGIASRSEDVHSARRYYGMLSDAANSDQLDKYRAPALFALANAEYQMLDLDSAVRNCEACLELYKTARDVSATARALILYGVLAAEQGDKEIGLKLLDESLNLCRHKGDTTGVVHALCRIGAAAADVDPVYARTCLLECLEHEDADDWHVAAALHNLAELDLLQGEIGSAFEYSTKSLSIRKSLRHSIGIANSLEVCGHIAAMWGDIETAVILLSRSEAIGAKLGVPRLPAFQARYDLNLVKLKSELGDDFERAWVEGTVLTLDEIIDEVELMLEDVEPEDDLVDELEDEGVDELEDEMVDEILDDEE